MIWRSAITRRTLPGDEATRLALSGAVSALQQGMISAPLAWKTPTGFVELTKPQVEEAAQAVVQHIQACFAAEATVPRRSNRRVIRRALTWLRRSARRWQTEDRT